MISQSLQSGFLKGHYTETLLVRLSDIHGAIARSQVTLLALFDVSAAFDTVDHDIVLRRLSTSLAYPATTFTWLAPYLQDRTYSVACGSARSSWAPAPFGLPQVSVKGPLLYIIYITDFCHS